MVSVYVVKYWNSWFDGSAKVKKIFSTEQKAREYINKQQPLNKEIQEKYIISEYELD